MPRSPGGISERDLQSQVRSLCSLFGWRVYATWSSLHSPRGFPDLVMVRSTRLLFAELKSATGKTSPEQAQWLTELARVPGIEVHLWRPADIEAIAEVLR